jgi:hypothetical protein
MPDMLLQKEHLERRIFRINILSRMRNGDDYEFWTTGPHNLWVKYERDSLFHEGEWIFKWYRTTDIEEVLAYLEEMDE